MTNARYIIYCRKSTDTEDKQILSLESQESEMMQIAKRAGSNVVVVLREKQSAKKPGRPVFNEALRMIADGEADAILCWKIDRLTRNPVDGGQIQWLLQTGKIKCITTFEKNYYPNDNVLLMSIEQAMANQYILDLSTNVKRGNRAKLERGEWPNRAPLGYLNDKISKTIIVDTASAPYVRRAFELYATGSHSLLDVSNMLFDAGFRSRRGKKVYRGIVYEMLGNPFYTGIMRRDDKLYRGNHEAIISKKLFDDVQYVLSGKTHPCTQRLFFPLRGFLTCEVCGCMLTASLKKGHQYYYCTNGRGRCTEHKHYLRETYLYEKVSTLFDDLIFSERKIELMYQTAKEDMERNGGETEHALQSLRTRLQSLPSRESRLLDAFVAEQISQELYDSKVATLKHVRLDIEKQIAELEKGRAVVTLEPTKNIFLEASRAKAEFLAASETKKRTIAEKLLWNLSFKEKNIAQVQYKKPYDVIAKANKNASISELWAVQDSNL